MAARISSLIRYPVKSARAQELREAEVTPRGFRGDRRWMVVAPDGQFLTLRTHPRLAEVEARCEPNGEGITLQAPGRTSLSLCSPGGIGVHVTIWKDTVRAIDAGDAAAAWLTGWLEAPARLVYMPEDTRRPVDPVYGTPDDIVSFADGYPILLLTEASLEDLNSRLDRRVPMARFRPNIVVEGAEPYAEDTWRTLRIGSVVFRVVKPCARCSIPTLNLETGRFEKEPLRTLATYRRLDNKTYFGQNLIPDNEGTLRVGDPVEILS